MEDNKYWLTMWKMIFVTICVVVMTIGGCQTYQNKQISEMVSKGAEPMKTACAITPSFIERSTCAIVATK